MKKELQTLGNSVAAAVTALGFTKNDEGMGHRQGLDVVAKTGGLKNWQAVVALKPAKKSDLDTEYSLQKDESSGGEADYILPVGATSCWITVDGFSIHIIRTDEGVIADILANRSGDIVPVTSTYAHHADVECAFCESNEIDIDDVAEWVGLHYRKNFDAETGPSRYDWLIRYKEAHQQ